MPKRSLFLITTFTVVAYALLVYGREPSRSPKGMAVAAAGGPAGRKVFSRKEYEFLWRNYRPNTGLADGPLSRAGLDNLAEITKNNTREKHMLPAFQDVIDGRSAALEIRLNRGLSADATIYLDYPYNAPVSLLDMAIKAGQRNIVKELLRHGASVGLITGADPDGAISKVEAPLPLAAADGEDDVVRLLLQSGANVEQRRALQTNNQTALDAAVIMQNVSTAYLLLTHGADVHSALGADGTVPDVLTSRYGELTPRQTAVRDLLIEYGAKVPSTQ